MIDSYTADSSPMISPIKVWVTPERKRIEIKGLKAGPVAFYIDGDELIAVVQALTEAAGLFVHLTDGCEDDSCKCFRNGRER